MAGGEQPCAAIERLPVIAALPALHLAAMQGNPGGEPRRRLPWLAGELPLERESAGRRVTGAPEDGEHTVACPASVLAMVPLEASRDDPVVTFHRLSHSGWRLLPRPGGRDQVGEEERQGALQLPRHRHDSTPAAC